MEQPPLSAWQIPRTPRPWDRREPFAPLQWEPVPRLPPFILTDGSGPAAQQTAVRLSWDEEALYVRFDCDDHHAWGTFTRRDEPIYQEEVVEVFLAAGEANPATYYELEVSPRGVLFDALIENRTGTRAELLTGTEWDCPGVRWEVGTGRRNEDWWAGLVIPWAGIAPGGEVPRVWRGNFYRVERPRHGPTELSAWSPTLTSPPDFHRPRRFGRLELLD